MQGLCGAGDVEKHWPSHVTLLEARLPGRHWFCVIPTNGLDGGSSICHSYTLPTLQPTTSTCCSGEPGFPASGHWRSHWQDWRPGHGTPRNSNSPLLLSEKLRRRKDGRVTPPPPAPSRARTLFPRIRLCERRERKTTPKASWASETLLQNSTLMSEV